ncbi:glycosyltransferase [Enterobacteriaceae bacterium RIT691]|nr:glycosyltransferase [Enterobacteriaceae bacterium RIT691]
MHIVHTEADGGKGGQPLRIINESLGMIQRGHQVTILCPDSAPLHQLAKEAGLTVVTMPLKRKNFRNLFTLRRWLREHGKSIDVINSHNSADTWMVALANLILPQPIPLVRTRHASGVPRNNWTTRWLFRKACTHIVSTGEALRLQMVALGVPLENTTSVPSGVDTTRFHPGDKNSARENANLSQNDFWLGVVSHLRPNKGHSVLLQALAEIAIPEIKLVIIGEGPHRETLEREVIQLNLLTRVVFAGHRSDPERWFQALDVAISPSHDMEGVPQGVLQSLASGIATIATDAGGTADAIIEGKTGLLVAQRDVDALREAILKLYHDAELRRTLAAEGNAYLNTHFTRECMLQAMEKVFSDAAQSRSSR